MKICAVGAEVFHADRQTDSPKLVVDFRNFANAPETDLKFSHENSVRISCINCLMGKK